MIIQLGTGGQYLGHVKLVLYLEEGAIYDHYQMGVRVASNLVISSQRRMAETPPIPVPN